MPPLIALYERAVGFYASLVNINAYHQPGVEAGKKAATAVLELQSKLVAYLIAHPESASAEQIADRMGIPQQAEAVYHVLRAPGGEHARRGGEPGKFRWAPRK